MTELEHKPLLAHQIYLVRHGEVDLPTGVCYGQLDCGVWKGFDDEQRRLNQYFTSPSFLDVEANRSPLIISSPLIRCHQLALGLKQAFDFQNVQKIETELQVNEAFKEINFGEWEGKTWQNIGQEQIEKWNDELLDYTFPEGDSARSFDLRVISAWDNLMRKLTQETSSKTLVLIVHAGVIRSILSHFLHIPLQYSLLLNIDKMSLSHIKISPQYAASSRCMFINKAL